MFCIAPSKADQAAWRYYLRNQYKAHHDRVRLTNTAWTHIIYESPTFAQIKIRPRPMTEAEKSAIIRLTGSSPMFDRLYIPVPRGRSRTQIGRKLKT